MIDIINCWRQVDFNKKPYIHKKDEVLLKSDFHNYQDFNACIKNKNFGFDDSKFHLNLVPVPYAGNILDAKIYILMLNPGFGILDYYSETRDSLYKDYAIKNVRQELNDDDFPFLYLNPKFLWHGGGQYWEGKLRDIIHNIAQSGSLSYVDSLSFLSKNIAVLELVPYHSKSYTLKDKIYSQLYTPKMMLDFVHDHVIPKATAGKACIISTRKSKLWSLPQNENIVIYEKGQTRGAHLSGNTSGGKKILEFLSRN